ncbi:MAG: hypothetical protein AAY43_07680 [Methanosarcina sp. 795]|nr:MAG: hypothetical protein AAY43_07680 [Methanosarcina sp. 795]
MVVFSFFTFSTFPSFTDTSASFTDAKNVNAEIRTGVWESLEELVGAPDLNLTGGRDGLQENDFGPIGDSNSRNYSESVAVNFSENPSSIHNESSAEFTNQTDNLPIEANETIDPTNQTSDINLTNNTNFTNSTDLINNSTDTQRTVSLEEASINTGSLGPSSGGSGGGSRGGGGSGGSDEDDGVLPDAGFSSSVTEGYAPLAVQFTDLSQNATEWNWDFGDGASSSEQNPSHTYSTAGTYTVTLEASNANGTDSESAEITVLEPPEVVLPPVAGFTSSITTGPAPFSVQFTDLSQNATEWNWDFGDGASSSEQNPAHTYSAPGTYTVTLTVKNTAGEDSEIKAGYIKVGAASSVTLTDLTLDGENSSGATTGSGAFTTNPEDSFGQIGVRDENGIFFNMPSSGGPLGKISIPLQLGVNNFSLVADGIYSGNEYYGAVLFLNGFSDSPQIAIYNSNGGAGAFSVQPAGTDITGSAEGGSSSVKAPGSSFYVTPDGTKIEVVSFVVDSKKGLTDEISGENFGANGVPDTVAKLSLIVTPSVTVPLASFSASSLSGTAPLQVSFTDSSTGSPTSWNWDFGDGASSTEQNPTHTYSTPGTYTATLTASNGNGTSSTSAVITVLQPVLPVADFSSSVSSGNAPLAVQFTDLSQNAAAWNWDFGDGSSSTEQNPSHIYSTAGDYTISLTASNANGTDSKSSTITVLRQPVPPVADFSSSVTEGYAPLAVQFTDLSQNAAEWSWDFGDGASSSEQSPSHTYSAAGSYTVTLTVSNADGTDSKTGGISVAEKPADNSSNDTAADSSGDSSSTGSSGNDGSEDSSGNDGSEDSSGNDGSEDSSGNDGFEDSSGNDGSEDSSGNDSFEDSSGNESSA